MTLILEFTIPSEAFPFGRAVSGSNGGLVTLERLVPLGESRIPFLWVDRADYDEFEERLRASDIVKHVEALTRVDGSVLYYVEWYPEHETFLNGLYDTGATILQAEGDGTWEFALRFNNPADLTQFHQFYQQHDFPVHIDRVSRLKSDDSPGGSYGFGLTDAQYEALLTATEAGYFSVPRDTKLEEIADELDVSKQTASKHIRKGTEKVVRTALLGLSAADFDPSGKE